MLAVHKVADELPSWKLVEGTLETGRVVAHPVSVEEGRLDLRKQGQELGIVRLCVLRPANEARLALDAEGQNGDDRLVHLEPQLLHRLVTDNDFALVILLLVEVEEQLLHVAIL